MCFCRTVLLLFLSACATWPEAQPRWTVRHGGDGPEQAPGVPGPRTTEWVVPRGADHGSSSEHPPPRGIVGIQGSAHRLERDACRALLRGQGQRVSAPEDLQDSAVRDPLWLASDPAGVRFRHRNDVEIHEIMDCRLAIAVTQWAEVLFERGVREVQHFSIYRPGARIAGSGRPSGHASGLAIDVSALVLEDDRELKVVEAWADRRRGVAPCAAETRAEVQAEDQTLLRELICTAVDLELFQVVLTPHHDQAHHNHVHLELRPDADWTYVR